MDLTSTHPYRCYYVSIVIEAAQKWYCYTTTDAIIEVSVYCTLLSTQAVRGRGTRVLSPEARMTLVVTKANGIIKTT